MAFSERLKFLRPPSSVRSVGAKPPAWQRMLDLVLRSRAALALVLLLVYFSVDASSFLTANNFTILAKHVAITAILAVGTTFVILTGGIDLSIGSIAGLSGILAGYGIVHGFGTGPVFPPVWAVVLLAIAGGACVGIGNGLLVTRLSVPPFIATLGTLYICRGAALLISGGRTFAELGGLPARHNTGFPGIGESFFIGLPTPVWIMIALALLLGVVASFTVFGRHVYAVGGNERAATLAGIAVTRVKVLTYVISGACAAVVGLIIAAQLEAAHPATGESFELNAIAAVVLGGTSLSGGRGSVLGSLLGAFVIGVLADGLVMLGVSEFWQMVIKGAVIVLAVAADGFQSRLQLRLARSR